MISVDRQGGFGQLVAEGKVTLASIEKLVVELSGNPDYVGGMNILWDLRRADISHFDRAFFNQLLENFVAKYGRPDRAVAYVVANDLSYGIMRMFEAHAELSRPQKYKIFRDIDEAKCWLAAFGRPA